MEKTASTPIQLFRGMTADELAALRLCQQKGVEGGAEVAHVHEAGRARGETGSDGLCVAHCSKIHIVVELLIEDKYPMYSRNVPIANFSRRNPRENGKILSSAP